MTDRELMQQALEALTAYDGTNGEGKRKRVLAALRERLAQSDPGCAECGKSGGWALYCVACMEKLVQPEQEPVAYDKTELNAFVQNLYDEKMREGKHGHYETMFHVVHQAIKRVTTPPRREWVGLTDEDMVMCESEEDVCFVRAIEAKLKEKNA